MACLHDSVNHSAWMEHLSTLFCQSIWWISIRYNIISFSDLIVLKIHDVSYRGRLEPLGACVRRSVSVIGGCRVLPTTDGVGSSVLVDQCRLNGRQILERRRRQWRRALPLDGSQYLTQLAHLGASQVRREPPVSLCIPVALSFFLSPFLTFSHTSDIRALVILVETWHAWIIRY